MTRPDAVAQQPRTLERTRRPAMILFDVNETLSDLSPMAERFEEVGAPGHLARTWFAGLLRDGFALAVSGVTEPFSHLGEESVRATLHGLRLSTTIDDAVARIMGGFGQLSVHDDVPEGVRALRGLGIRLATLSNGSASVAERLLGEAGVLDHFEQILSVEQAGIWKPAAGAYTYAVEACGVAAADAMLVAVHPWDTDGAARAGLASAWINRAGTTYPGYFRPPDVRATSLVQLAERLR